MFTVDVEPCQPGESVVWLLVVECCEKFANSLKNNRYNNTNHNSNNNSNNANNNNNNNNSKDALLGLDSKVKELLQDFVTSSPGE